MRFLPFGFAFFSSRGLGLVAAPPSLLMLLRVALRRAIDLSPSFLITSRRPSSVSVSVIYVYHHSRQLVQSHSAHRALNSSNHSHPTPLEPTGKRNERIHHHHLNLNSNPLQPKMMELGPAPRTRRPGVPSSSTLDAVPLRDKSDMAFSGVAHTTGAAASTVVGTAASLCVGVGANQEALFCACASRPAPQPRTRKHTYSPSQ